MKEKQGAGGKGSKAGKIDQSEITVVLQGSTLPVYGGKRCIERSAFSVRQVMPRCQIIVSTWEGEDIPQSVQGAVDKVIFNKDPGGFANREGVKPNNVNRQILSSLNGLKQVQTKYALKMRTDFVMKGTGFLKYFDVYNSFSENYRVFQKRLVCAMAGTGKPTEFFREPFRVSDFLNFGLTSDLLKLYDIPLMSDEDASWFTSRQELLSAKWSGKVTWRYFPEQHIWIGCLRKNGVDVKCQYCIHYNDEIAEQSNRCLVNNFYPASYEKLGIYPLKTGLRGAETLFNIEFHWNREYIYYTKYEWLKLYKKYCDNSIRLPQCNWELFILIPIYTVYYSPVKYLKRAIRKLVKLIVGEGRYAWLKAHLKKAKAA